MKMPSLFAAHLPLEVLQDIIRRLDPITLISLAQTCRSWRTLINPIRHDFIQRLLALELLPAHGIVPLLDEHDMTLTPPWGSDEWKTNKYACCGCMKLRTHMSFGNHAILGRPYRKPPFGNVEADKATVTEWEPLTPSARWRRIQERAADEREVRRECRRVADARRHDALQHAPAHPFARVSLRHAETDRETERYLVGSSRQKRRCIDCQRPHGNSPMLTTGPAGKEVPMVKSRQLKFQSIWERHFPGLIELLPPEKLPRYWRTNRGSSDGIFLTLYVVCCPSCGTWQEYSAFRRWELLRWGFRFPQPSVAPLLCNRCHLQTHQDPALLADELSAGALQMLRDHRRDILGHLGFGWRLVSRDFDSAQRSSPLFAEYAAVGREVLDGFTWISPDRGIVVEEADLPDLRRRFSRYKQFIYHEIDTETRAVVLQSWLKLWVEDYGLREDMYHWISKQIERLESDPALVLRYVLERDPYRV